MDARRLTARFVETVTTQNARDDIRDLLVQGLQLRLTSQGHRSWAFRYRRKSDGRLRRVTLGAFPGLGLDAARGQARELIREVALGCDPAAREKARKLAPTFEELSNMWIEDHGSVEKAARSLADDCSMLRLHILPQIGPMKADALEVRHLAAMLAKVKKARDARFKSEPSTAPGKMSVRANRVFELVRSILWWAEGQGIIKHNPAKAMQPPSKKSAEVVRDRTLSATEVRRLWRALMATPVTKRVGLRGQEGIGDAVTMTRPLALAMLLSLVTGQRIGETAGIAKSELDLNDLAPMWIIAKERAKNGRAHRVPLTPQAVVIIGEAMELSAKSAFLFPGRGRIELVTMDGRPILDSQGNAVRRLVESDAPIIPGGVTKAWSRSRGALGLSDVNVHDLRRTALTGLAEAGAPPLTISLVANHASATHGTVTMKTYVKHPYDREKREALEAWGSMLDRINAGTESANVTALKTAGRSP